MNASKIGLASAVMLLALAPAAMGQTVTQPGTSPRATLDIGAIYVGGGSLGTSDATYLSSTGTPVTLFSTAQSIKGGPGVVGHLNISIAQGVALELSGSWSRPVLQSKITGDTEGAESTTATQTISQFLAGGGLVKSFAAHGRVTPFVRAAASWMRQLSGDQSFYKDGVSVDLGAGVRYSRAQVKGHFKPYGLRADVWMNLRSGGIELDTKPRILSPGVSASLIFKL